MTSNVGSANLMGGIKPLCETLVSHYMLPAEKKEDFLTTPEAVFLFNNLPQDISNTLREGFLNGGHGSDEARWALMVDYFQNNSEIIPALTENPGTFTMLDRMYHFQPVTGVIDEYFLLCKAGGQALKNRYDIVTAKSCQTIKTILENQSSCKMVDFGSGPGRNAIDIVKQLSGFCDKISIDCVDTDRTAIKKGLEILDAESNQQIHFQIAFIEEKMAKLSGRYKKNIDFGLLIGVLCGMTFKERVTLLKILKRYFKPGAKLIAAALLDTMAEKDLLCAFILEKTANWRLQYRPLGDLQRAFIEAGWQYEGFFQEEETKFYEIGIGVA